MSTKAARQPSVPPINEANGMPSTEATDQPRNTSVMARPRCAGVTSKPTQAAAWGVKMAAGMTASTRSGSRVAKLGMVAHRVSNTPYQTIHSVSRRLRSQLPIRVAKMGAPRQTKSAEAEISCPAEAMEMPSDWLMSLSVPGTTMMPVPITKLPNSNAHRERGNTCSGAVDMVG